MVVDVLAVHCVAITDQYLLLRQRVKVTAGSEMEAGSIWVEERMCRIVPLPRWISNPPCPKKGRARWLVLWGINCLPRLPAALYFVRAPSIVYPVVGLVLLNFHA